MTEKSVFDFEVKANDGREYKLGDLKGKTLLIVNTASKCGFTPQYDGLEALHKKYSEKGLTVLGFPCDQFAHQEPGGSEEIAAFCRKNYGVSFPLMEKINVNGKDASPLFAFLRKKTKGLFGDAVRWNFTKFLVSSDGLSVKRFAPTVEPKAIEPEIEKALAR